MRASRCALALAALSTMAVGAYGQTAGYTISTIGGSDPVRDGRPAASAILQSASGIAFSPDGRLFIADSGASRIRMVTPDATTTDSYSAYAYGTISTFAGVGAPGFGGDGGPASEAYIDGPGNVAVDGLGSLYFSSGTRVRKVDQGGIVQTVAGGGTSDAYQEGAPATSIALPLQGGVAVDAKNHLYVSEMVGGRIFRVSPEGLIYLVAGGGTLGLEADGGSAKQARLLQPQGLVFDGKGNLYFCEQGRYSVRKIAPDGTITTFAGTGTRGFSGDGGPASKAQMMSPASLALDGSGNLLILDSGNGGVRSVSPDGVIRSLLEPNPYVYARSLAIAGNGNLWIVRTSALDMVISGSPRNVIGDSHSHSDGLMATETLMYATSSLAVDRYGLTYFTDSTPSTIWAIDRRGIVWTLVYGSGGALGDGYPLSRAQLSMPSALAFDGVGNLWIGDANRVRRVSRSDSIIQTVAGTGVYGFSGDDGPAIEAKLDNYSWIAIDSFKNLFISSPNSNRVRKVGSDGIITTVAGNGERRSGGDSGPAKLAQVAPLGIAVDREGTLYIADVAGNRIRGVSKDGIITTIAGGGTRTGDGPATEMELPAPRAVAVTPAGEVMFTTSTAIFRVSRSGWLERIAGGDMPGYWGDGGPAREALLNRPGSLCIDGSGAILFVDAGNYRIRKLTPVKE
jgi:trimeric autotransporter adhesin